jgi:hypothetical protein
MIWWTLLLGFNYVKVLLMGLSWCVFRSVQNLLLTSLKLLLDKNIRVLICVESLRILSWFSFTSSSSISSILWSVSLVLRTLISGHWLLQFQNISTFWSIWHCWSRPWYHRLRGLNLIWINLLYISIRIITCELLN